MKTLTLISLLVLCSCASRSGVALRSGVSLYVTAPEGKAYVVERFKGGTSTNWVRVSNFIGNGTNAAPEFIAIAPDDKAVFYRFRPE